MLRLRLMALAASPVHDGGGGGRPTMPARGTCPARCRARPAWTAPTCPTSINQQVRQGGKFGAVRFYAAAGRFVFGGAAGKRLGQRGVVVGACNGLHLKAAVAGAVGLAVHKYDHAADAGAIAPVGNIETFDDPWRGFQTQHLGGFFPAFARGCSDHSRGPGALPRLCRPLSPVWLHRRAGARTAPPWCRGPGPALRSMPRHPAAERRQQSF